jgi:hypothetical protein
MRTPAGEVPAGAAQEGNDDLYSSRPLTDHGGFDCKIKIIVRRR